MARATHHHIGQIVGFGLVYALVRFAEAYGLWRGKHWAEWFAVISAALYLPLEFRHLAYHPTALSVAVILLNVLILIYLGKLLAQQRAEQVMRIDVAGVALEHAPVPSFCRGIVAGVLTVGETLSSISQARSNRSGSRANS